MSLAAPVAAFAAEETDSAKDDKNDEDDADKHDPVPSLVALEVRPSVWQLAPVPLSRTHIRHLNSLHGGRRIFASLLIVLLHSGLKNKHDVLQTVVARRSGRHLARDTIVAVAAETGIRCEARVLQCGLLAGEARPQPVAPVEVVE